MSFGLQVNNSSGALMFDLSDTLGRIVGYGYLVWAAGGVMGVRTVVIPALIDSDFVGIHVMTGAAAKFTVSRSGTTVTVERIPTANFVTTSEITVQVTAIRFA